MAQPAVQALAQQLSKARASYAITIRMENQDSGLRRLDDERSSSVVALPTRWN